MKKAGRPKTHPEKKVIGFTIPMMKAIEKWRRANAPHENLSEAIRRLVEIGLEKSAPAKKSSDKQRVRALELAEGKIDEMVGNAPNGHVKRRLLEGHSIVREVRIDRGRKK